MEPYSTEHNPTGRFSGLADTYARHRPDYPPTALDLIGERCGLGPGSLVVDVGCGTGISSRLLAARGWRVIGVEPNDDMRAEAVRAGGGPEFRPGQAEATELPDTHADAVVAAQAFHWFRPEPTLAEFRRILKPVGWVALIWNERDKSDPFTAEYGTILHNHSPDRPLASAADSHAGDPLLRSALFVDGRRDEFSHEQPLDRDGLIGRALSVSYAPRDPDVCRALIAGLSGLFDRSQQEGRVVLRYRTRVFTARRL